MLLKYYNYNVDDKGKTDKEFSHDGVIIPAGTLITVVCFPNKSLMHHEGEYDVNSQNQEFTRVIRGVTEDGSMIDVLMTNFIKIRRKKVRLTEEVLITETPE